MITCPYCGEYNGDTRETCFKCGESLNNPQGVERRVMCSQCSAVYTTAARHCPRCGGLLREFTGSVEMARMIKEEREYQSGELEITEKALCIIVPLYGVIATRHARFDGDWARSAHLGKYTMLGYLLYVILLFLVFVVTLALD